MGMEVPAAVVTGEEEAGDPSNTTLGRRPSILLIGSKDVGKRTILNRLIADKQFATNTLSAGATCHG
jgi:putative ribosome biogenesis GTPase RsgA